MIAVRALSIRPSLNRTWSLAHRFPYVAHKMIRASYTFPLHSIRDESLRYYFRSTDGECDETSPEFAADTYADGGCSTTAVEAC